MNTPNTPKPDNRSKPLFQLIDPPKDPIFKIVKDEKKDTQVDHLQTMLESTTTVVSHYKNIQKENDLLWEDVRELRDKIKIVKEKKKLKTEKYIQGLRAKSIQTRVLNEKLWVKIVEREKDFVKLAEQLKPLKDLIKVVDDIILKNESDCKLCSERMDKDAEIETLDCGHEYHIKCFQSWKSKCCLCDP